MLFEKNNDKCFWKKVRADRSRSLKNVEERLKDVFKMFFERYGCLKDVFEIFFERYGRLKDVFKIS